MHAILGNHDWWEDKTVQRDGLLVVSALHTVGAPKLADLDGNSVRLVDLMGTRSFRLYRNRDVIGVELPGGPFLGWGAVGGGVGHQRRRDRARGRGSVA